MKKGITRREFMKGSAAVAASALASRFVAGCGGGSGSKFNGTINEMTPYIEQEMAKNQVTGLAIALVDDQEVVWARGFGYADLAGQRLATADTPFEIGSNSKTFTGTMIMQLAEKGRLNIDDPVTKYIPSFSIGQPLGSFPSGGGPITVRTLMNHHSGIPGDLFNGAFSTVKYPDYNARLVRYLAGEYAGYPTNFLLSYSNTAVSLLAEIIAAASGQSFEEYSNQLFQTLGMNQSSFFLDGPAVSSTRTKGYASNQEYGPFYINIPASGSIYATANDMARYLKMVMADGMGENGRVLKKETLDLMLTPTNSSVSLDMDTRVGLSWFLNDAELDYAGKICWHNGGTMLMLSHMTVLRDQKLAVMVMTNSVTGGPVSADVARKTLKLAVQQKAGIAAPSPPAPAPSPIVSWTPDQLDAVAGIYVRSSGYDLFTRTSGGLQWTIGAGLSSSGTGSPRREGPLPDRSLAARMLADLAASGNVRQLVPRANGWFSTADSQETQIEFKDMAGRKVMIVHSRGQRGLIGERYIPAAAPAAWTARLGQYELTNLDPNDCSRVLPEENGPASQTVELKTKDGVLILQLLKGAEAGQQYIVAPVSDTTGYMRGLGRNLGSSVQIVSTAGGERLQFLDWQYRKI